jgi:hypothetical protein
VPLKDLTVHKPCQVRVKAVCGKSETEVREGIRLQQKDLNLWPET